MFCLKFLISSHTRQPWVQNSSVGLEQLLAHFYHYFMLDNITKRPCLKPNSMPRSRNVWKIGGGALPKIISHIRYHFWYHAIIYNSMLIALARIKKRGRYLPTFLSSHFLRPWWDFFPSKKLSAMKQRLAQVINLPKNLQLYDIFIAAHLECVKLTIQVEIWDGGWPQLGSVIKFKETTFQPVSLRHL